MVIARDLGTGPTRAFGSALKPKHRLDPFPPISRIGRTRKLLSEGPCAICGERFWLCEYEIEETNA